TEYPRDRFIHEQFAAQVAARPDAIAVQCDGVRLTYRELDRCANAVAVQLIDSGVRASDRVGLFLERSIGYVVASLAVLKSGATYLPLEPTYPKDRLLYMVVDSAVRTILTTRQQMEQLTGYLVATASAVRAVEMSEVTALLGGHQPAVQGSVHGDSGLVPAYIMYTSGSSGTPKGVEVTHRGVVRLVTNTNFMSFTSDDVMLGLATTMFDASTWETWTALLNGGRLVLSPAGAIDSGKLGDLVHAERVTTLLYGVALFQQVVDDGLHQYKSVRQFLVGGDVAPVPHLQRAMAQLPECTFVNAYGPTENAVISAAFVIPNGSTLEDPLPIGRPISNSHTYVLDAFGEPAAIGVWGELCVGGDGVALGYVNRPELTTERFIRDLFSGDANGRLYRTGDGARWRVDGTLQFLGRLDNQVKIRGYRIEPGEIEAALFNVAGVKTAAVTVRPDQFGQKRLLGYYVPKDGQTLTIADVRTALMTTLPDYMVPAVITQLQELPLNNGGKVDRAMLPEPSGDTHGAPTTNVARPVSRSQRQLAQIWEGLLDHRPIGIDNDFFEVGGHSLLAVRMMTEVERSLGRKLSLATLLERPTIRYLAKKVDAAMLEDAEPLMVVLQSEGYERPFAFVHGDLTGGGWYCRKLSAMISPHIPMIVLPTFRPEIAGDAITIEAMARRHLIELRKVQPNGPYRLGGFCAGGLIALEMARELVAQGEAVERVIMVDGIHPNAASAIWRPILDRYAPPATTRDGMARRVALIAKIRYYDERLQVVRTMRPRQLARWANNAVRIRLGRTPIASDPSQPAAASVMQVTPPGREKLLFYSRAVFAYVPRSFVGHVDLIFSSDPRDQLTNPTAPVVPGTKPELGTAKMERAWKRVLPNAHVHHLGGSHIGIIVENLGELGACIRKCLGVQPT
ncbi:MAG: amino acid adenylation domain-containing protein, partial [Gemmatimonadaceae bacterium]